MITTTEEVYRVCEKERERERERDCENDCGVKSRKDVIICATTSASRTHFQSAAAAASSHRKGPQFDVDGVEDVKGQVERTSQRERRTGGPEL